MRGTEEGFGVECSAFFIVRGSGRWHICTGSPVSNRILQFSTMPWSEAWAWCGIVGFEEVMIFNFFRRFGSTHQDLFSERMEDRGWL